MVAKILRDQGVLLDHIVGGIKVHRYDGREDGFDHQGLVQAFPIADQVVFRHHRHTGQGGAGEGPQKALESIFCRRGEEEFAPLNHRKFNTG